MRGFGGALSDGSKLSSSSSSSMADRSSSPSMPESLASPPVEPPGVDGAFGLARGMELMRPTPRLKSCGVRESAFGRFDLEGDACAMFAAEGEALTMEGSSTKESGRRGERRISGEKLLNCSRLSHAGTMPTPP